MHWASAWLSISNPWLAVAITCTFPLESQLAQLVHFIHPIRSWKGIKGFLYFVLFLFFICDGITPHFLPSLVIWMIFISLPVVLTTIGIEHKEKDTYERINHVFYYLHSAALTSRALLTLEGLPLPGLANS